jgi:hypothetical protein
MAIWIVILAITLYPSHSHRTDPKHSELWRLSRSGRRWRLRGGVARDAEGAGAAAGQARRLAAATRGAEAAHGLAAVLIRAPRPAPRAPPNSKCSTPSGQKSILVGAEIDLAIVQFFFGRFANCAVESAPPSGLASYCSSSSPRVMNPRLTIHSSYIPMYVSTNPEYCSRIAQLHPTEPGAGEAGRSGPNFAICCGECALL